MAVESNSVIPWGRSFEEYIEMFNLSNEDLAKKIIGCGDGPASFNKRMRERGHWVVSCDPVYNFAPDHIVARFQKTQDLVRRQASTHPGNYNWEEIPSVDALIELRSGIMNEFLADYDRGEAEGRYLPYSLPHLPFDDGEFDIALCSNLLFLFANLGYNFHVAAILEMLRVAQEVRVFPLVDLNRRPSPWQQRLLRELENRGYQTEIITVNYSFQRNAPEMLRAFKKDKL